MKENTSESVSKDENVPSKAIVKNPASGYDLNPVEMIQYMEEQRSKRKEEMEYLIQQDETDETDMPEGDYIVQVTYYINNSRSYCIIANNYDIIYYINILFMYTYTENRFTSLKWQIWSD